MMSREEAEALVETYVKTKNLRKHMYAVAAIMRALAEHLNGDPEEWEIAGILHDLDYEETKERPELHGLRTCEMLEVKDVPSSVIEAIKAHNHHKEPDTPMEYALICADNLSGMLVACALVRPERRLSALTPEFVARKMREPSFAKGADRKSISLHSQLGLSQEEFLRIGIDGICKVSDRLGL